MGHFRTALVAAVGAVSLVGAGTAAVAADGGNGAIEFHSMTPVTGAAVGAVNDRGIKGGGLAWVIKSGRGEVSPKGHVEVRVRGLVIPSLGNINPIKSFRATVSCMTPGGVVNVTTGPAPTGPGGKARIEGNVSLPADCMDPIVFVVNGTASANGTFAWFAMSNPEREGGDD